MNTSEKIKELRLLTKEIEAGGGKEAIAKQHQKGKLTARNST